MSIIGVVRGVAVAGGEGAGGSGHHYFVLAPRLALSFLVPRMVDMIIDHHKGISYHLPRPDIGLLCLLCQEG